MVHWNPELIIIDLKHIVNRIGYFPSINELIKMGRHDLVTAMSRNGRSGKYRKLFGYKPIHKTWSIEMVIKEINEIIEIINHFPSQNELISMKKNDLLGALPKYGGLNKIRISMGYDTAQKPSGYWTDNVIISNLEKIIMVLKHFPTHKELISLKRQDLSSAMLKSGGSKKFKEMMGYDEPIKRPIKWTSEETINKLKSLMDKIGHFPSPTELELLKESGLRRAIVINGGFPKFRRILNSPVFYNTKLRSYLVKRGKKSEKIVKKILIDYCNFYGIPFPLTNVRLSKGNVIEFVCNTGKRIGIDVTNTKGCKTSIKHKWTRKDYYKYLDELWIVVFSDVFTPSDYRKFNNQSPDNVKILSIHQFIEELDYSLDEYTKSKIDNYCKCTFSTKGELIRQDSSTTIPIKITNNIIII